MEETVEINVEISEMKRRIRDLEEKVERLELLIWV